MSDRLYRTLVAVAVAGTLVWLGWWAYDAVIRDTPSQRAYFAAEKMFADGLYERALASYEESLAADPNNIFALRGIARALTQLGRYDEARAAFDKAIEWEPDFAATYANRGILYDRMGLYEKALADYETALRLDPEVGDGPGWLTRFLRNQAEKPPGIADRLAYLKEQLALPPEKRLLRVPAIDAAQRPYKK